MNIQQLRYVVATAEHGSMTAAAAALFVAQPALSRAVRQLERELDLALFARAGRGVALTPAGETFVHRARAALGSIDRLRTTASADQDSAPLVIAASPTLQAALAIPILAGLREHGARIHARLLGASSSAEVAELVAAGRADLGLCDSAVSAEPAGLVRVAIGRAEVRLYSPAGLDLPDRVTFADLAAVPLVLPTAGSDRRASLDAFFEGCGITPEVAVETDERHAWLAAVSSGVASCLWHSLDPRRAPLPGVVSRGFDPPMHRTLVAVQRGADERAVSRHLLEVLRQVGELVA
ncbi:LysR family transcriptional regulator [Nocardioides nitrophenolicus]|uniref:LysR family transcriptional regulator n=1 Tax=Nocardioides nitrophenolicus TaxID=60489 RepID=UPI0019563BA1|nr:LysR family transcriptional regulator [Nocardioides nitrophenolicus]MBM7519440.1 DNA-binding transcriptional LysR family regulator [Nocardioides nitrophenolicus]